jgi:hypothetical protein
VLAIVVGLLLTVSVALGILILVALPNLRQGSRFLTPDGQRAVKRAKQKAKQKPLAAAGSTWHGLVAVRRLLARFGRRAARIWAPISAALHEAMDRLEAKDAQRTGEATQAGGDTPDVTKPGTPIRHAAGRTRADVGESDGAQVPGGGSVGRPRPMPPISGPIPEITDHRTIDLREEQPSRPRREVDQDAGSARRAR